MKFIEDINQLLRDNPVRQLVAELADHINDPFEQLLGMGFITDSHIRPREDMRVVCSKRLTHILISRLPKPPALLGEELATPFIDSFTVWDDSEPDFDQALERFLGQLATLPVATRRSQPLQVGTGPSSAPPRRLMH